MADNPPDHPPLPAVYAAPPQAAWDQQSPGYQDQEEQPVNFKRHLATLIRH